MSNAKHSKLPDLLTEIGINKVIYVDDIFGETYQVEQFLGIVTAYYETNTKRFEVFSQFDLTKPLEGFTNQIKKYWDENPVQNRLNLFNTLRKIYPNDVNNIIEDDNTNTISELIGIQEENLHCLTPEEWDQRKESLLNEGDNIFCLFDFELNQARTGMQLLKEATSIKNNLMCCILTNKTTIENENSFRETESTQQDIAFDKLIVLSKERSHKKESFSDGIKKALLINHWNAVKQKTLEVIKESYEKAASEINDKFDSFVFDDIILKSSLKEGVSEGETIFRLSNILYQDYAKKACINQNFHHTLSNEVQKARIINKYNFINSTVAPKYPFNLRHLELFEEKETLNFLHSPLRNGDIFNIGGSKYILVVQPCDLMLRQDGARNLKVATLLKIREIEKKDLKGINNSVSFPLHYFEKGTTKVGLVDYKEKFMIDFDLLDLSVFNTLGNCTLTISPESSCPDQLHIPLQNRFKAIKLAYESISKNLITLNSAIEEITDPLKKDTLRRVLIPVPTLPKLPLREPYFDGANKIDFGISRILHLQEPKSSLLLTAYNRYLSRDAESHDFAFDLE